MKRGRTFSDLAGHERPRPWLAYGLVGVLFSGLLTGGHSARGASPERALRAGAAEIDITPPVGYRMAGYFDERISTGVHDPLHAKALVLQQGDTRLAFVFCDLLGLSLNVSTNARALASRLTGIAASNIVVSATHTHTGPLFDDIRRDYFHQAAVEARGGDPHETIDYPAQLIERLARVVAAANSNLAPAQLQAGSAAQPGLNFNRRYWMKNGKVVFNPGQLNPNIVRPAGPSDPEVGLLLARTPGARQPFAGATVFAMHSDTVSGTLYSADYEYFVEQSLRQAFGSGFISGFALGACGDLNHINVAKKEPTSGFAVAQRIGDALGQTVVDAAPRLPVLRKPALASRNATLTVALQPVSAEQLARARALAPRLGDPKTDFYARVAATKVLDLHERGSNLTLEVQAFRLDKNTVIVCLPGEVFVELGLAIKHASPFRTTLVVTLCNDRPSYIPTRKAFAEGSYEVENSRVTPGTGESLVETAVALLRQLRR